MARSGLGEEDLTITVVIANDVATVSVIGEVDVFSVRQLSGAITSQIDAGTGRVIVDLSGVTFIDGFSIEILVGLTVAAAGAHMELVFANPSRQFLRVKQLVDSRRVLHVLTS